MRPLRHSYTNRTLGDGATVVKCYQGPGALARSRLEQAMLHALEGQLPVPQILDYSDGRLTMTFMNGVHGQELLDAGRADGVLRAAAPCSGESTSSPRASSPPPPPPQAMAGCSCTATTAPRMSF